MPLIKALQWLSITVKNQFKFISQSYETWLLPTSPPSSSTSVHCTSAMLAFLLPWHMLALSDLPSSLPAARLPPVSHVAVSLSPMYVLTGMSPPRKACHLQLAGPALHTCPVIHSLFIPRSVSVSSQHFLLFEIICLHVCCLSPNIRA